MKNKIHEINSEEYLNIIKISKAFSVNVLNSPVKVIRKPTWYKNKTTVKIGLYNYQNVEFKNTILKEEYNTEYKRDIKLNELLNG